MNFFRRLTADTPGELLAAQVATTSRTAETTDVAEFAPAMPTADNDTVFAALGFLARNPGVPDHDTPGFPNLSLPEGEPR